MNATITRNSIREGVQATSNKVAGIGTKLTLVGTGATTGDQHFKFYTLTVVAQTVIVHSGRIGTLGIYTVNRFGSDAAAVAYAEAKMDDKARKGYATRTPVTAFTVDAAQVARAGSSRTDRQDGSPAASAAVVRAWSAA